MLNAVRVNDKASSLGNFKKCASHCFAYNTRSQNMIHFKPPVSETHSHWVQRHFSNQIRFVGLVVLLRFMHWHLSACTNM